MICLLIGGSGSGKSAFAEGLLAGLPPERCYLATMRPCGGDGARRIARHRALREGKGFRTVERYLDVGNADIPPRANLLLECVGNLLANEMFEPGGGGSAAVLAGIGQLAARCDNLILIANDVGRGGAQYGEDTLRYMRAIGEINRALAARADCAAEIVCGMPNWLKGGWA